MSSGSSYYPGHSCYVNVSNVLDGGREITEHLLMEVEGPQPLVMTDLS